uniref:Uncharacterized protein n=1 Tax=Arundo donax TaxID=35708 RepID=A0A0A9HS50_ARUDO
MSDHGCHGEEPWWSRGHGIFNPRLVQFFCKAEEGKN